MNNATTPAPSTIPTAQGPIDLAEARSLALTFGCDLGRAVGELEARELNRWPPAQ